MAKREREEEFEVSKVAPLQPLSRYSLLLQSLALSIVYCTTIFTNISATTTAVLYNDLYQYQCYYYCCTVQRSLPISVLLLLLYCTTIFTNISATTTAVLYNDLYQYQCYYYCCTVQRSLPISVLAVRRSLPSISDRHNI